MLEWLKNILGDSYTDEVDAKISAEIGKNFVSKADFNQVNAAKKKAEDDVKERDGQLEELKKSTGDAATFKQQIAELQNQNAQVKQNYEAELARVRLDNAVENALMAAGAKNSKAAKSLIDMSKVKLGEDGKLTGFSEQLEAVQKSDSYLFAEKQQNKQNFKGFQPGASGDVKPNTKVDTTKMSYDELCAYLEKNPDTTLN